MIDVLPTLDLMDNAISVFWGGLVITVMYVSLDSALRVTVLNVSRVDTGLEHILKRHFHLELI